MKKILISVVLAASCAVVQAQTLKEALGPHFMIGAAVGSNVVYGIDQRGSAIALRHFNTITAENCMKPGLIHPEEGRYDWADADRTVAYGHQNNMKVIGHCLVWHTQSARWMFTDSRGKKVSRAVLIDRMYHHITDVVKHFKGKVFGWDVVNEAVDEDGSMRHTPYYDIIGPDYIELALRFAQEADPKAELYLNDFNMSTPARRDTYARIIKELKAKGVRIDGMGLQGHHGLDYPNLDEWEKTIDVMADCGVKVMITELDVNVLPNPKKFSGAEVSQNFKYDEKLNPYRNGITKEGAKALEDRYMQIFDILKRHSSQISRVTFWNINDGTSWLNDFPVFGRTNYPLFFDRDYNAKPIVDKVIKMYKK